MEVCPLSINFSRLTRAITTYPAFHVWEEALPHLFAPHLTMAMGIVSLWFEFAFSVWQISQSMPSLVILTSAGANRGTTTLSRKTQHRWPGPSHCWLLRRHRLTFPLTSNHIHVRWWPGVRALHKSSLWKIGFVLWIISLMPETQLHLISSFA